MEGKKQQHIMLYSRKVKTQLKRQNIRAVYGKGAVTERVKSGLQSFVVEISDWTMLHGRGDQFKLIAVRSRRKFQNNQRYTTQEISRHTQNLQIRVENHSHQLGYVNRFDVWVPC